MFKFKFRMDVIIEGSVCICYWSPSYVLPIIVIIVVVFVFAAAVLFEFCEELENTSNVSMCVKCLMPSGCHMHQQA